MQSPDQGQDNIVKIGKLFPECISEELDETTGKLQLTVDFDQLRQVLSNHIVEGPQERYHLDWPGKREALVQINIPINKTLRPDIKESKDFDKTRNLFIEGDNLDVLKLIQETYLGKIKLIYIDPPYNTGNDFIFRDNFTEKSNLYNEKSNQVTNMGERLIANPDGSGRFHSNWLTMMMPRLRVARNLLTQDGAIFVSCDEVEQPRLRLIMDEIFGQSNFVADMVWTGGRKNNARFVSISHEYIVCYAKDTEYLKSNNIKWRQHKKGLKKIYKKYDQLKKKYGKDYSTITKEMKSWYGSLSANHPSKSHKHYSHADARGIYFPADISSPGGGWLNV